MPTDEENEEESTLLIVLAIGLVVPGMMWAGFVLTRLWLWFVVPLGAPVIDVWQAAGLCLIVDLTTTANTDRSMKESIALMLALPAIAWVLGGICHYFMLG